MRESCGNQSEEHNSSGILVGAKDNEDCGWCPDNELIAIDHHVACCGMALLFCSRK